MAAQLARPVVEHDVNIISSVCRPYAMVLTLNLANIALAFWLTAEPKGSYLMSVLSINIDANGLFHLLSYLMDFMD